MSVGFDLVQEEALLILEILVTFVAIVMMWEIGLVFSHLGNRLESKVATYVGAGNSCRGGFLGHFGDEY